MRLNLGCGNRKVPGWVNVDKVQACHPDQVVDLEQLPWPWADDSVEEVMLSHVLEHLGEDTKTYLGLIKELYRVCRNGAKIVILVPHPRHDFFLDDPTHVRTITPGGLALFSQKANRQWIASGAANTPLGIYHGVDFSIESVNLPLDEPWRTRHERKEIADDELQHAVRHYNNVVVEFQIVLRAVKPAGSMG
ncbi:MAG TPA: methyltransferase domain-containing protein [Pseudolabrys sp.]|jgi:hypothetical protein|nr:methyltransferase domain-containing protein [Pseudolabrys sp.]